MCCTSELVNLHVIIENHLQGKNPTSNSAVVQALQHHFINATGRLCSRHP